MLNLDEYRLSNEVDADIVAGPEKEMVFDPASVSVSTGESITWHFASSSHNVSCHPAHAETAQLPTNAEPFSSYDGNNKYRTNESDTTFNHTFTTLGEYVYVCIPHETNGMIGEITVAS